MHPYGRQSGWQHTKDRHHRRRGNTIRHWSWMFRRAMMSQPGRQQRALDAIGQRLVAEDPGFGLRFAFFARLTRHEAIPETEQVPRRPRRVLRRPVVLPLVVISLIGVLVASGLTPSRQTCAAPAPAPAAASAMPRASHAARCPSGRAINLEQVEMR
jgi:hypothetical protein